MPLEEEELVALVIRQYGLTLDKVHEYAARGPDWKPFERRESPDTWKPPPATKKVPGPAVIDRARAWSWEIAFFFVMIVVLGLAGNAFGIVGIVAVVGVVVGISKFAGVDPRHPPRWSQYRSRGCRH